MSFSKSTLTVCVKCSSPGDYFGLDPKQAVYCRICFLKMVQHKFSYSLGKNRVFKEALLTNALFVYTGNESSAVLFSLLCDGLKINSAKRLRIDPSILFLFTLTDINFIKEQIKKLKNLLKKFSSQNWKVYFAHSSSILNPNSLFSNDQSILELNEANEYNFLLKSIKDNSLKQEIIRLLTTHLIVRVARQANCSKIILAENAELLANISFNAMCFGRGYVISELTAVIDKRLKNIEFIRPLRDVCNKEIQLYLQLNESSNEFLLDKENNKCIVSNDNVGGIQQQTANFINSLQSSGFSATVATILSISSKLAPNELLEVNKDESLMNELYKDSSNVFNDNENYKPQSFNCCVCFARFVTLLFYCDKNNLENKLIVNNNEVKTCDACSNLLIELKAYNKGLPYNQLMNIFKN